MSSTDLVVIDISHYQGNVDFAKVKAAGIVGVICKATEGSTSVDSKFADNYRGAMNAGLAVSTYHFLHHGSVNAQIDHYIDTVHPEQGERVCIDYEDEACTLDDLHAAVSRLMNLDPTLQISVYSGHLLKDQLGNSRDDLLADNTSLWLAQYTSGTPSWPDETWPSWSLWQYTDHASVSGVSGNVDGNRFNGSKENCLKWFGPAGLEPPAPGPEPAAQPNLVALTTYPGNPLVVTVNGAVVFDSQMA